MMTDDDDIPTLPTDEEWEAAVAALSDDELIAYMQRLIETVASNREDFPAVTDEMIERLRASGDNFQDSVDKEKVAHRELDIAKKRLDHSADQLLRHMPDKGKGN